MCGPFCDSLCQLIGATWADSSARNRGTVHIVRCRTRLLGLFALVMGLISCGALALAVTTDYWLHTEEPFYMDNGTFICLLHINSGLWRGCFQCQYGKCVCVCVCMDGWGIVWHIENISSIQYLIDTVWNTYFNLKMGKLCIHLINYRKSLSLLVLYCVLRFIAYFFFVTVCSKISL